MRISRHAETQSTLLHFESCAEYADIVQAKCHAHHNGGSWVGGETWEQSIKRARSGNIDLVPAAEAMIEKIVVDAQREKPLWVPSMAGAFPIVADYLMGRPDAMRRRFPEPNEQAPIKIYVELTSSAAVSAADMIKRGTAILALALLLNMQRSVELSVVVGLNASVGGATGGFCVVPLGTSPLDIALACNALTSVGFVRSMGYAMLSQSPDVRAGGGWAWGLMPLDDRSRARYVERLRKAMDATPEDIIVPPIFTSDPILKDPLGFVQRSLAEALKIEQEA